MSYIFKPAVREQTPLIVGIAGPTKSGKTKSSLRLATGMANGGTIAMINAEGLRGHQYADQFKYVTCDIEAPYRPMVYTEALEAAAKLNPAVVIIDSASHMHDGPGGILEWHEEIMDAMAKGDPSKRDRVTFTAWIKPKAAENQFIYQMLSMKCPVILCLRAKEKIKIVTGKPPIDLGWQPIVGERVAFETIFTLTLTPHCKGVPDLAISDMREPFDSMIPKDRPLDEGTGEELAQWAAGGTAQGGDGGNAIPESSPQESHKRLHHEPSNRSPDQQIVYQDHRNMIEKATTVAALSGEVNAALDSAVLTIDQKAAIRLLRDECMVKLQGKKK